MFYNVFIKSSAGFPSSVSGIDEEELRLMLDAYLKGQQSVTIQGKKVYINDPNTFKIFSFEKEVSNREEIIKIIEHVNSFGRGKIDSTFGKIGKDVTNDFLKGKGWGSEKEKLKDDVPLLLQSKSKNKIFISHSSKDEPIVTAFVDKILKLGLGLTNGEIFYSSIDATGIRTGEDFKNRIKEELLNAKGVIQIITENYKQSEVCLNEMGAAWVLNLNVVPFILEPIKYDTVGFIHSTNQMLKLSEGVAILKFVEDFSGILFDAPKSITELNRQINEFLKVIAHFDK